MHNRDSCVSSCGDDTSERESSAARDDDEVVANTGHFESATRPPFTGSTSMDTVIFTVTDDHRSEQPLLTVPTSTSASGVRRAGVQDNVFLSPQTKSYRCNAAESQAKAAEEEADAATVGGSDTG